VNAALHVPAREIAAIGARKSAGTKTADGRALPVAIIDVAGIERRFFLCRDAPAGRRWGASTRLGDIAACASCGSRH